MPHETSVGRPHNSALIKLPRRPAPNPKGTNGAIKSVTASQGSLYFRANTAKTDQDIVVEVDRYIVWPGQALGYKMGQLKIRELRTKAEQQLGARFNVRGFHDVVLGQGAVPLDVLERQVGEWVSKSMK